MEKNTLRELGMEKRLADALEAEGVVTLEDFILRLEEILSGRFPNVGNARYRRVDAFLGKIGLKITWAIVSKT